MTKDECLVGDWLEGKKTPWQSLKRGETEKKLWPATDNRRGISYWSEGVPKGGKAPCVKKGKERNLVKTLYGTSSRGRLWGEK